MRKVTFTEVGPVDVATPGRHLFLHQCDECGALVRIGHNQSGAQQHIRWHHRMSEMVDYPMRWSVEDHDVTREEPRA